MRADTRSAGRPTRHRLSWMSWLMLMVRTHPHLTLLIVVGATLRVITLAAYQPALLFHADAYGYLRVADDLIPSPTRPSLYPLLLRLAYPLQSLVPIVVMQHVVGIGVAIGLYALLRRLGAGPIGGAVGAAPMFLDAYLLNIEQYVLSETLFLGLLISAAYVLVHSRSPTLVSAGTAGLLLGLAGITRVVGVFLVILALVYLAWKRAGPLRVGACLIASLIPMVCYAIWFHSAWGTYAITTQGPLILYGRVSPFADCSNPTLPEYQRTLCDTRPAPERPGTEFYVWRTQHPLSPLRDFQLPPGRGLLEVLGDFSRRIILAQPLDYARVVAGDMYHYFGFGRWEEPRDASMAPWEFTDSFDAGPDDPAQLEAEKARGDNFPRVIRELRGSPEATGLFGDEAPPKFQIVGSLARFLDSYQDIVYTPGPVLAVALILGIIGAVLRPRRRTRKRSARPECFLFASMGTVLLLVPAATAVFDYRYLLPAIPFLSMAGVLGSYEIRKRGSWTIAAARPELQPMRGATRESSNSERHIVGIGVNALSAVRPPYKDQGKL